jgi:hypothetical protein
VAVPRPRPIDGAKAFVAFSTSSRPATPLSCQSAFNRTADLPIQLSGLPAESGWLTSSVVRRWSAAPTVTVAEPARGRCGVFVCMFT